MRSLLVICCVFAFCYSKSVFFVCGLLRGAVWVVCIVVLLCLWPLVCVFWLMWLCVVCDLLCNVV